MTADELLEQLDDAYGPCDRICISCPSGEILKDIRDVIIALKDERDKYKLSYEAALKYGACMGLTEDIQRIWNN